jgi:hypothetical protein
MQTKLPSFFSSKTKFMARELHIAYIYPMFTGNLQIPKGKGYWYLCNEQPNHTGSEYHQLTKLLRVSGRREYTFAQPNQCYGVDRSKKIIKKNKKLHPDSHWIAAEWNEAIQDQSIFDPALVYLDTTSFADGRPALFALRETLRNCNRHTVVIANVMMNHPRAGDGDVFFNENALVENLFNGDHPEALSAWNISPENKNQHFVYSYDYRTSKTLMRSLIFFKGVLPPADKIAEKFVDFKEWCSFSFSTEEVYEKV